MNNISFNILGVCVLRDVFSYHENDAGYIINQYVNEFSPLYCFEKGTYVNIDKYNQIDTTNITSNFIKRCILFNVTGGVLDYISKKKSDYLILDIALTRTQYFVLENGQYCYGAYKKLYDLMSKNGLFPPIKEILQFNFLDKKEIRNRLKIYCNKIKKMYDVSKIILFEIRNSILLYDSKNDEVYPFNIQAIKKANSQNELIDYCFSIVKEELQGCHIVYMPKYVLCDKYHHLNIGLLHFTKEYYDYGINAINIITKGLKRDDEERMLYELYTDVNNKCANKYFNKLSNKIIDLTRENIIINRKRIYFTKTYKFFNFIYNNKFKLDDFFNSYNLKTILLYGENDISKYIFNNFKKNINFDIMAKDLKNFSQEFSSVNKYYNYDGIIITDVIDDDKIFAKLTQMGYNNVYKLENIYRYFIK